MENNMGISRRKFLGIAGTMSAMSALALSGCTSGGSEEAASAVEAAEPKVFGDPLKLPTPVPEREDAVWKVDYVNEELAADFVHDNWRMAIDSFPKEKLDVYGELGLSTDVSDAGMDTLQTAGGADFTANQLDWILGQFEERAGVGPEKITCLDLRGESHGLIDGNVFMLWINNNFVNEGTPTEEVIKMEADELAELKKQEKISMYQTVNWGADFDNDMVEFTKPEIMSEEELCKSKGMKYVRLADTNHFRPDDHEVDLFCEFMAGLPDDEWIYMHCYAGEGRTTCFMVLADIYKNYDVASFDDIAARQGLIGPVDVRSEPVTTKKTHYKKKASIERRAFLQWFYQYAKETNFQGPTWTEWARERYLTLDYYPELTA